MAGNKKPEFPTNLDDVGGGEDDEKEMNLLLDKVLEKHTDKWEVPTVVEKHDAEKGSQVDEEPGESLTSSASSVQIVSASASPVSPSAGPVSPDASPELPSLASNRDDACNAFCRGVRHFCRRYRSWIIGLVAVLGFFIMFIVVVRVFLTAKKTDEIAASLQPKICNITVTLTRNGQTTEIDTKSAKIICKSDTFNQSLCIDLSTPRSHFVTCDKPRCQEKLLNATPTSFYAPSTSTPWYPKQCDAAPIIPHLPICRTTTGANATLELVQDPKCPEKMHFRCSCQGQKDRHSHELVRDCQMTVKICPEKAIDLSEVRDNAVLPTQLTVNINIPCILLASASLEEALTSLFC